MLAEFVDKLLQETKTELHTIDGRTYSNRGLHLVAPPIPEALSLATLSGLVNFVQDVDNEDGGGSDERFLVVDGYDCVSVHAKKHDDYGRRELLALAKCAPRCTFPFGKFLSPEEFLIALQTSFLLIDGDDLNYVLGIASGLQSELVTTSDDDGLSQKAAIRQGVALKTAVTVKRTVKLYPFRTFEEVEQPASTFLFRLRSTSPERPPECALFLADGDAWKLKAVLTIQKFLQSNLGDDYTVIA